MSSAPSLILYNQQSADGEFNGEAEPRSVKVKVRPLRALEDNYVYLVHRAESPFSFVIDPSTAAAVTGGLGPTSDSNIDLKLCLIFNTHHHWDHVGGNEDLVNKYGVPVCCSEVDQARVPSAREGFGDGQIASFDGVTIEVLSIPGHTKGQIAYHLPVAKMLFAGDTLFSMGCGRLLEGTPAEMEASLARLSRLPSETRLYFGHEYTEKNGAFAREVEPENAAVMERLRTTRECLARGRVPAAPTLADEMKVNPFLRLGSPAIRQRLGLKDASRLDVFTSLRRLRDQF